jgi:uncharacterized protein (DUF305 family)
MGITWRLATLVILICALDMQALQHDSHTHLGDTLVVDRNWAELGSSMEKMHQAMASVEASGDGDVDFVRLMLPHHQAAIDMAKTQLLYGKDPQMRRLAQEIITDQQSEIARMHLWLTQRTALSAKPGYASDPRE